MSQRTFLSHDMRTSCCLHCGDASATDGTVDWIATMAMKLAVTHRVGNDQSLLACSRENNARKCQDEDGCELDLNTSCSGARDTLTVASLPHRTSLPRSASLPHRSVD